MSHDNAPPTIPTCCAGHRLAVFDLLETMLVNDTLVHFDNMLAAGWPLPDALDALRHSYKAWLLARLGDAIDLGCDLLEIEVAA